MSILYFISGYLISLGIYTIFRISVLNKEFKKSSCTRFLEYFEKEYLKRDKSSFRSKYSFIYNSRLYSFFNYLIGILSVIIGMALFILLTLGR